jgi:hypothetical protein
MQALLSRMRDPTGAAPDREDAGESLARKSQRLKQ